MPQHESSNWPPWGTDEPVKAPARTSSAPRADPRSFADSFGNDLQQRVNHYPAPDLARSQSLHAAGEPAARPRRGAGSSFYETSWKISFASDPSSDTLSDATETRTQFQPQPHVAEKRRQPPKTKSEVVLGALPSREFLASTTQVDFRDKSGYAETRELIVPSENKETWKTTRRGDEMITSANDHFPTRSIEVSRKLERAGASRTKLTQYNVITGGNYPNGRRVGGNECFQRDKHY